MKHKRLRITLTSPLTPEGIDALSLRLQEGLAAIGCDTKSITGLRLSAEEILLTWREHFGEAPDCALTVGRSLRRPFVTLTLPGGRFDPTDDGAQSEYTGRLLARLGLRPDFTYARGANTVTFKLPAPAINPLLLIAGAVVLSVLCGTLGGCLPAETRAFISTEVLQRVQSAFFGLLNMVALPLIFFSLITGICGIGDAAAFSGIGARLVTRCYFLDLFTVLLVGGTCAVLFRLPIISAGGFAGALSEILDMLFAMLPTNVAGAFYHGNFTQIMLLAVAIGMAMLAMGRQCAPVIQAVEQLQGIFDQLMRWVCKLLPIGVFAILVDNIWANTFRDLLQIWKPLAIAAAALLLYLAVHLLSLALRTKTPPGVLWRKLAPVFLVAFASASSIAAYGDAVRCGKEKLGVDGKVVDFGLPLLLAVCSIGSSVSFMVVTVCAMAAYEVPITLGGLILACVLCTLLVMSSPSTAGGPVSCFAIMFAHLGIPEAALGMTILAYLLLDFPATGINITSKLMILLDQCLREKTVDTALLRKTR